MSSPMMVTILKPGESTPSVRFGAHPADPIGKRTGKDELRLSVSTNDEAVQSYNDDQDDRYPDSDVYSGVGVPVSYDDLQVISRDPDRVESQAKTRTDAADISAHSTTPALNA
jgi:hypothetical protein